MFSKFSSLYAKCILPTTFAWCLDQNVGTKEQKKFSHWTRSTFGLPVASCGPTKGDKSAFERASYQISYTPNKPIVMRTIDDNPDWFYQLKEGELDFWKLVIRNRMKFSNAGLVMYQVPLSYNCKRSSDALNHIKIDSSHEQYFEPKASDQLVTKMQGDQFNVNPSISVKQFLDNNANEILPSIGNTIKTFEESINSRIGKENEASYPMNVEASLQNDDDEFDLRMLCDLFEVLRCNGSLINGVNSPYLYIGVPNTFFAFHIEDMNLQSINLMYEIDGIGEKGSKYWIAIDLRDTESFIDLLVNETKFGCKGVLQSKRFVPFKPEVLAQNGIRFQCARQTPGSIIMTMGAHGGRNDNGVTFNEAVNIIYPQFFKVHTIHDSDDKLARNVYDGCKHEENKGVIGHHNGLDFSIMPQGSLLNKGEEVCKILAISELCILHHNHLMDSLDVFNFSKSDKMKKFRKRLIISMLSLIEFTENKNLEDPEFWTKVRVMMGSTMDNEVKWIKDEEFKDNVVLVKNLPFSSFNQFYETEDEILTWSIMMLDLLKSKNTILQNILKFIADNQKLSANQLFQDLEDILKPKGPINPGSKRRLSTATINSSQQISKKSKIVEQKETEEKNVPTSSSSSECDPNETLCDLSDEVLEFEPDIPSPAFSPISEHGFPMDIDEPQVTSPPPENLEPSSDILEEGSEQSVPPRRRSQRVSKSKEAVDIQQNIATQSGADNLPRPEPKGNKTERVDLLKKLKDKNNKKSLTTARVISEQDKNFIYQLAISMNKPSIEEEISKFEEDRHSLSYFLVQLLSGKNLMNWNVEDVEEILKKLIEFAITGEKIVEIKEGGEVIDTKTINWDSLMEEDIMDNRTSHHTGWKDMIFEDGGHFWKSTSDILGPISIWLYDSFNVSERKGPSVKATGVNARKVNFLLRGLLECLFMDLEEEYPLNKDDTLYLEWKDKKYNWKPEKLKLPADLAELVPEAEIDTNWDDAVEFLKKHRQIFHFDNDKSNVNNKSERNYFTTMWKDAEALAKFLKEEDEENSDKDNTDENESETEGDNK